MTDGTPTVMGEIRRLAEVWTSGKGWSQQALNHWATLFERERPEILRKAVDDLLKEHKSTRLIPSNLEEYVDRYRRRFEIGKGATHCSRCGNPVGLSMRAAEQHDTVCRPLDPTDKANNASLVRERWYDRNPKFRT